MNRAQRSLWAASGLFAAALAFAAPASAADPDPAAQRGLDLLRARGCLACHTLDGSRQVGPSFAGLFGSTRQVRTGGALRQVSADEAYIERSLREPDADVADGYPAGAMPSFTLEPAELGAVTAALKHLSRDAPKPGRGSIWSLVAASLLFVGLHLVMSSKPIRTRAVSKLGGNAFQGIYSLVILGVFAWMLFAWTRAPFLPLWASPAWTRYVPLLSMPVVFVLMVAGYSTKNPTTAGQESLLAQGDAATGILRITRHPANLSNALWGFVHLPPNGDVASVCLFGSVALLAILGTLHIERRRRRDHGEAWQQFTRVTSIVPFAAILQGRNQLRLGEIGAWRVALGLGVFALALAAHTYVIGASPYPF